MLTPDGDRIEPLGERVPDPGDLDPAADHGQHRQHRDGHGHRPRALAVGFVVAFVTGLLDERRRLAEEDDEEQPEGVEAGQQRAEQAGHEEELRRSRPLARAEARIASFEKKPESGGIPTSASEPTRNAMYVSASARRTPPISRMSCSPARWWITRPAARKSSALKNACVSRWNIPFPYAPIPAPRNM